MSSSLFSKWRRWLDRIDSDQLLNLLINQQVFHQLQEAFHRQSDKYRGAELADWMVQGYVAFAATGIRRMMERPRKEKKKKGEKEKKSWTSISLVILMEDLKKHDTLLTRDRFSRMYRGKVCMSLAHRDFDSIVRRKGAKQMTASRIERDIAALRKVAKPVVKLVNKVIAHTEADRRRIGRATYGQIDTAIDLLRETFRRYSLLLNGSVCDVPKEDVRNDIAKIWP